MSAPSGLTVLHLAPHPDDEAIGAGATLLALNEAGHHVINLACGLGRSADRERRLREARDASERARFELLVHDPPLDISRGDDLDLAQRLLTQTLVEFVAYADLLTEAMPVEDDWLSSGRRD
jgi:LmbE family N-acetylglucosaminyl deacetylase